MFDDWGWYGENSVLPNGDVARVALPGGMDGPTLESRESLHQVFENFSRFDATARSVLAEHGQEDAAAAVLREVSLYVESHELPCDLVLIYDIRHHDWRVGLLEGNVVWHYPDG